MCFSCGCKEIACAGFDKYVQIIQKGNICVRQHSNLSKQIICAEDDAGKNVLESNMSAKRFKALYGEAVAKDPGLQNN